ncbi:M1 family metallopeptidase [Streptomyces sp. NPDC005805]|uniref:M1 family metallopeptidase n=1 Tax=Streptomyces sp. NPDC005805 TaxID=3157068 RepID=UPI003400DE64
MLHSSRRRLRAALLVAAASALVAAVLPEPRALGIGDRLFPELGNPGYDVIAYDISLAYRGANDRPMDAVTVIDAWAERELGRVNLDFTHGTVRSVEVDGSPAAFATAGEDLVVKPDRPVAAGTRMAITVTHTSDPRGPADAGGWVRTGDGLALANQADAAHRVFPCNDHPSDKAYFTFRVTAPKDTTVVAGGSRVDLGHQGTTSTWTYRTAHPMATELAQVSIGRSAVLERRGPHGLPVRDVVPAADRAVLEPWLRRTPEQIAWMEQRVGRYPFENYGVLVADADTGFELETQTLSLFERSLFTRPDLPAWYVESIMVHELAHQWFGNSVSPRTWSDLWLNEGHATWYEALYAQEKGERSLVERMRRAYRLSDGWRAAGGPPARPDAPEPGRKLSLFRPVVYDGSALVLYALRQTIGTAAFERLERAWVSTHRDGTAGTEDFTDLASRIAGRDLGAFFDGWLYGATTPPMPGHPDWRSDAPGQRAPGQRTPAPGPSAAAQPSAPAPGKPA